MAVEEQQAIASTSTHQKDEVSTRLSGRWLPIARTAWIAIALLALGLYIGSFPTYYAFLHVVCTAAFDICISSSMLRLATSICG